MLSLLLILFGLFSSVQCINQNEKEQQALHPRLLELNVSKLTPSTIGIEVEIPSFKLYEPLKYCKVCNADTPYVASLGLNKNTPIWKSSNGATLQVELQGQGQKGFEFTTTPILMDKDGKKTIMTQVRDIAIKSTEIMLGVHEKIRTYPKLKKWIECSPKFEGDNCQAFKDDDQVKNLFLLNTPYTYIDCSFLTYDGPLTTGDAEDEVLCSYRLPSWTGSHREGNGPRRDYIVAHPQTADNVHFYQPEFWNLLPEQQIIGSAQITVAFDPTVAGFTLWENSFFQGFYIQNGPHDFSKTLIQKIKDAYTTAKDNQDPKKKTKTFWLRPGADVFIGWLSYYVEAFGSTDESRNTCHLTSIKDSVLSFNFRTKFSAFHKWINEQPGDFEPLPQENELWTLIKTIAWDEKCNADTFTLGGAYVQDQKIKLKDVVEGIHLDDPNLLNQLEPGLNTMGMINSVTDQVSVVIEFRGIWTSCFAPNRQSIQPAAHRLVHFIKRWYKAFDKLTQGKDWNPDAWRDKLCKTETYAKKISGKWLVVHPDFKLN